MRPTGGFCQSGIAAARAPSSDNPSPAVSTTAAHDGRQLGKQIRLDPLGAFSLFGVSLHELGNRVAPLAELLGPDGERSVGQLLEARAWDNRFALLDRLLTDRIAAGPMPSPELAWPWRTMRDAGGAVRVADLADGAGWSHRHPVARFREQIGATPKTAARVLPYARAPGCWPAGTWHSRRWRRCVGYADQPHMTREFAALAGYHAGCGRRNRRPRHDGAGEHFGQLDPPIGFLQDLACAQA
jgi:hypothetical protein